MPRATNTQFAVAVHVLTYLAGGDGAPVSSDELAESVNANPVYVRRVLGPLREAGLVHSRTGSHGGWELARTAERIRLDEVWSIVQGDDAVLGLHGPNPQCPVGAGVQRALVEVEAGVAAAVRAELGTQTVRDVLAAAVGKKQRRSTAGP
jgi:Rrf2 family protein